MTKTIMGWAFWAIVIGIQVGILIWGAGKLNVLILQPAMKLLTF